MIQGDGSPNGNTSQLVMSLQKEQRRHEVEVVSLLKNEVKGCLDCNACCHGKLCIQKDTLTVLPRG